MKCDTKNNTKRKKNRHKTLKNKTRYKTLN